MSITLEEYAGAKALDLEVLKGFGLSDSTYMGEPAIRIPYLGVRQEVVAVRFRVSLDEAQKFMWPNGTKAKGLTYGLDRLDGSSEVALVEGESDCHTLWACGFPAVGLPGAGMWDDEVHGPMLAGCPVIYAVIEPDDGGEHLAQALSGSPLRDKIRVIKLNGTGDPSAMHLEDPTAFPQRWRQHVELAVSLAELEPPSPVPTMDVVSNQDGERDPAAVEAELQDQFGEAWDAVSDLSIAELLDEIEQFIRRYVVLTSHHQVVALALWVLHTHLLDAAFSTPYILVTSPELRAGKTRLLEVLELLVHEPEATVDTTSSSLFRAIEEKRITLLLDEVDEYFKRRAEDQAGVRSIINSGYRRGKYVTRSVWSKQEKRWVVERFHTFCPKALAGIDRGGQLGETLIDRSIPIRLMRKREDQQVEMFIAPLVEPEAGPLRARLSTLSLDETLMDRLGSARPVLPAVHDRACEIWWPLLAIADEAGDAWPHHAREACVALTDEQAEYGPRGSQGVELLEDIRQVFETLDAESGDPERPAVRIFSSDLVKRLIRTDGSRWDKITMSQNQLATMLRPYGIRTRDIRIGEKVKRGSERSRFSDVFAVWLEESE